ncbi:uncharacterized protein [Typha latifolia]|uniref:uncharacterized protein isoform X1 n=1 Tax=Typha latifolia TaxID=4733 RepID=UPI003C2FF234
MAGILQYFDFGQAITARKLTYKRHNDGLEAPRNSLDFPLESSQSYPVIHEDVPYSCHAKNHSKANFYLSGAPVNMLIDEQISNRMNDSSKRPGVIARLMGMDTLPSEIKPMIHAEESKYEKPTQRKELSEALSTKHASRILTHRRQTKRESVPSDVKQDLAQSFEETEMTKPKPREHPQEELLQKFKKEFEAWQASKIWEHSWNLDSENDEKNKHMQILSQRCLDKGKAARLVNSERCSSWKKSMDTRDYMSNARLKVNSNQESVPQRQVSTSKANQSNSQNGIVWQKGAETNFKDLPVAKFEYKEDRSSSPTRIVILKPCPERSGDTEESFIGSPEILKRENNMQDFLEEVKNRLKREIEGKSGNDRKPRWIETETSSVARWRDPKQIAQNIANQIRDNVTKDFSSTLMPSESTRSYRNDVQFNGKNHAAFVNRDTRKLLSERLKNVLKNEADFEVPLVSHRRATSLTFEEAVRIRPTYDNAKKGKKSRNWDDKRSLIESKTISFRHEPQNAGSFDVGPMSPRNLLRSFSAPVSGTSFVKLLAEDQHVPTGAHVQRKHEVSECNFTEASKNKKDVFDLKGRVSNLTHNFTLKKKFFTKKIRLANESVADEFPPMTTISTAPSSIMNAGIIKENPTEVPPSPASLCNSPPDEICRAGYPSPVSPLEASFTERHFSSEILVDISYDNPELIGLSEELEIGASEELIKAEGNPPNDELIEVESHAKAYVRNILLMAGLYDGHPFDQAFSRWDISPKPIPKWVFHEVEETCGNAKVDDVSSLCNLDTSISHRMLFDLINEALPRALQTPLSSSTFKKWFSYPKRTPQGKKLLDDLWYWIQKYLDPPEDVSNSLDSIIAQELSMARWSGVFHEDFDALGRELESEILEELISELIWDILYV